MNLSRAATLAHGELFSVGRVQTPTLALLVEREKAIRDFVPEEYLEVVATFAPRAAGRPGGRRRAPTAGRGSAATGRLPRPGGCRRTARRRRPSSSACGAGGRRWSRSSRRRAALPPPLLYDLTELQRHANRLYGLSAKETLAVAQALYEEKKLLTYPRTDSRHLSRDVAAGLPAVVAAIAGPYSALLAPGTGERPLGRRFVDDAKVTDHHAIVPTAVSAAGLDLSRDERRIYDLVCRRLLMAWHDEHVFAVTTVVTRVASGPPDPAVDRFASSGTAVQQAGWKVLEPPPSRPARPAPGGDGRDDDGDPAPDLPPGLAAGQPKRVAGVEAVAKKTRPPRRFTDATLLTAMETGRGRPRRPRALGGHEGARPRHARDPRRDHRDAPAARLRRAAGQGPGGHRHGHPARRPRPLPREERGAHRRVGGPARAHARGRRSGLPEFMQRIEAFVRELRRPDARGPHDGGCLVARPDARLLRRSPRDAAVIPRRPRLTVPRIRRLRAGAGGFLVARQDRSSSE